MKIFEAVNSPAVQKALGIVSIAFAGITAVVNAVANQRREQEFEDLKKTVSELQDK